MKPSTKSSRFGLRMISNRPRVRVRPMSRAASRLEVDRGVLVADAREPRVERLVRVEVRDPALPVQPPRDPVDDRRIVVDHRLQVRPGERPFDHHVPLLDEPIEVLPAQFHVPGSVSDGGSQVGGRRVAQAGSAARQRASRFGAEVALPASAADDRVRAGAGPAGIVSDFDVEVGSASVAWLRGFGARAPVVEGHGRRRRSFTKARPERTRRRRGSR